MKHKHAEVIKAFVDGKKCSWWDNLNEKWQPIKALQEFDWCGTVQIDAEPKPDVIRYICIPIDGHTSSQSGYMFYNDNLKLTFDGETGKLKLAEVIK